MGKSIQQLKTLIQKENKYFNDTSNFFFSMSTVKNNFDEQEFYQDIIENPAVSVEYKLFKIIKTNITIDKF
jgi:hypothetical protein